MLKSLQDGQFVLGYIPIPDSDHCKQLCVEPIYNGVDHNTVAKKRTVHLDSLLSGTLDTIINRRLALTRKQRFGIAAALAWAVLHLCDSPWLGTRLSGNEIQMFLESQAGTTTSHLSTHPYLSYNFGLSNPETPTTMAGCSPTEPASRNEELQNNPFKNITLFTLAIRLIELGLGSPFSELRERYRGSTTLKPTQSSQSINTTVVDDYEVAKYQIEILCRDPGQTYAHAADRCLRFLFPGPENMSTFHYRSFRKIFFEDVVAPIQATFELIPGSCSKLPL